MLTGLQVSWFVVFLISTVCIAGCNPTLEIQLALETKLPESRLGKIAYIFESDLWIFDLDQGNTSRLTYEGGISFPKWASDSRQIAYLNDGILRVIDLDTLKVITISKLPIDWFEWSPQTNRLAYASSTGGLFIWDSAVQKSEVLLTDENMEVLENFSWSNEANAIIYDRTILRANQTLGSLEKIKLEEKKPSVLYISNDQAKLPQLAQEAPGNSKLAFWKKDRMDSQQDADGLPMCILFLESIDPYCMEIQTQPSNEFIAWSIDQKLAMIAEDRLAVKSKLMIIDTKSMDQRILVEYVNQHPLFPAWSPDGKLIAISARQSASLSRASLNNPSSGRRIWKVDVNTGAQNLLTQEQEYIDEHPLWSADGKEVLFARLGKGIASLWLMQEDGTNQRQVVNSMTPYPQPSGKFGTIDWHYLWDWWRPMGN